MGNKKRMAGIVMAAQHSRNQQAGARESMIYYCMCVRNKAHTVTGLDIGLKMGRSIVLLQK